MKKSFFVNSKRGFTLIETLVGITIFFVVAFSAYGAFVKALEGLAILKTKNAGLQIANEKIEIIKNLPYKDVGVIDGVPSGKIPHNATETRDGITFYVTTTIRNIDDPFDGTIGGTPNDSSPADNKLAEIEVVCHACKYTQPLVLTARIAPRNLETQGLNGALFVQAVDSTGSPIAGASVYIENVATDTPIIIEDVTGSNGMLQIVDVPPGTQAYHVRVSKEGYSSDETYSVGDPENPVPNVPHANVVTGLVTQVSFAIDRLSNVLFESEKFDCSPISGIDFNLKGSKMIGYETYKFNQDLSTESGGKYYFEGLEWDSYDLSLIDSGYALAGTNPMLPINIEPNSEEVVKVIVSEKNPNAVLVNVKDAGTGLPISDAEVTISEGSNNQTKTTGLGYFYQTDWSGGAGQQDFSDNTRYETDNGRVENVDPAGQVSLVRLGSEYLDGGELVSSIFDVGTSSDFHVLEWLPFDQNINTGENPIKLQLASNEIVTATSTWDFVGPSGSSGSYYTTSGEAINSDHNGDRYMKYKMFLDTDDTNYSPIISDVSFTYSSNCVPPGQAYFDNLNLGDHILTVTKDGYQEYSTTVPVNEEWQSIIVNLTP